MPEGSVLPAEFYRREVTRVARDLLGRELVRRAPEGTASGRIVETEAYLGTDDPAAHVFGGRRTPRTEILYRGPARAYVYLVYGLHHCLNLTAGEPERAGCVLIRALEPLRGRRLMAARRGTDRPGRLASGPGRLCAALAVDRQLNGEDLVGNRLFVSPGKAIPEESIATSPRIGIDYAGEAREWPLRFHLAESPWVSR